MHRIRKVARIGKIERVARSRIPIGAISQYPCAYISMLCYSQDPSFTEIVDQDLPRTTGAMIEHQDDHLSNRLGLDVLSWNINDIIDGALGSKATCEVAQAAVYLFTQFLKSTIRSITYKTKLKQIAADPSTQCRSFN